MERAKRLLEESVEIYNRTPGKAYEDFAMTLISLGRAREYSGDLAGAEETYRQAISILEELPQRYEGRRALVLLNLGGLLTKKGDYDKAIEIIGEAGSIVQRMGQTNFYSFYAKYYLSGAYMYKGEYQKTAEEAGTAIDLGRKIGIAETPDFVYALNYLGLSLTRTARAKEGEPYLRESLELARRILSKQDARLFVTESVLAECLSAQNRFAEAEPLIVDSFEGLKATQGGNSAPALTAAKTAAELYERWKKPDLAAKYRGVLAASATTH